MKIYRILLWVQGSYTLLTALWGLVDIDSFMAVTGPKTDIWLVKTVSVVLAAIGIVLITEAIRRKDIGSNMILGMATSAGLAFIDFYYSGNKVISWVYALDGIAELVFLFIWVYLAIAFRKLGKSAR